MKFIGLFLLVLLSACSGSVIAAGEVAEENTEGLVCRSVDLDNLYRSTETFFCYDKETRVEYIIITNDMKSSGYSISPRFNADGSVRLWESELMPKEDSK